MSFSDSLVRCLSDWWWFSLLNHVWLLCPNGLWLTRLLLLWDSSGKNIAVSHHSFPRGSSWLREWTQVSCIAGGFFYQLKYQGQRMWNEWPKEVEGLSKSWLDDKIVVNSGPAIMVLILPLEKAVCRSGSNS